jgi:hypothetical protein
MSYLRVRREWVMCIARRCRLFFTTPTAGPVSANACGSPKAIDGAPRDGGTPFEEPEKANPGNAAGSSGGPASWASHELPSLRKTSEAPELVRRVGRRVVPQRLVLVAWP